MPRNNTPIGKLKRWLRFYIALDAGGSEHSYEPTLDELRAMLKAVIALEKAARDA